MHPLLNGFISIVHRAMLHNLQMVGSEDVEPWILKTWDAEG